MLIVLRAVMSLLFFFKQKTAYEMRISDWSSDVCSSDLIVAEVYAPTAADARAVASALRERFAATDGIVDIDTSMEADAPREIVVVDRARAVHLGRSEERRVGKECVSTCRYRWSP